MASVVKDVGLSIKQWQADTVARKDQETGMGPIGLLFNSIIDLLRLILIDMKTQPDLSQHYQSLESSSAALFFWGTELGVSRGELDEMLQNSEELRDTCLLVIVSIGQFIISGTCLIPKSLPHLVANLTQHLFACLAVNIDKKRF